MATNTSRPPAAFGGDPGERYGELADRLGDLISAHDPDGTYRYVSAGSLDLLGYRPRELVGTWSYELVHPRDEARVTAAHRNVLEAVPTTVTYRIQTKKGRYRWVETMSRAVLADGDHGPVTEILCSTRALDDRGVIAHVADADDCERVERVQQVLTDRAITPVFQPILDLDTGEVVAYEGLSRFPDHRSRGPERWFADAWEVGLGSSLELLALREICSALPELPPEPRLNVNASPPTLASSAFLESLGPDADRVTIELTEHLDIEEHDELAAALTSLQMVGCKTAIDDFGAGFASLKHLLRVGPDWIKLDISLTERIGESPVAHALTTALLGFSEQTGVQIIAEGIETEQELDAVTEIGIPLGQGFHLGMPAPLEQTLAAIS